MCDEFLYKINAQQLHAARNKVVLNAKDRLKKRADRIIEITNTTAKAFTKKHNYMNNWTIFKIDIKNMMEDTLDILYKWDGGKYHKAVKTNKESFEKTRNYWCREKAIPIGDKLIHPILSQLLYHIDQWNNTTPKHKALLYIDIIRNILNANIKFPRTKPKPLILHASIYKIGLLKEHFKMMIKCFNFDGNLDTMMQWGTDAQKLAKNKNKNKRNDPANNLYNTLVDHLTVIKSRILECDDYSAQICNGMQQFMQWIDADAVSGYDADGAHNDEIIVSNYNNTDTRPFQITNTFVEPVNQVHHNLESSRNREYERKVSVERHVEQMRTQRYERNEAMYMQNVPEYRYTPSPPLLPTSPSCCCHCSCHYNYDVYTPYNNYPPYDNHNTPNMHN